MEDGAVLAGVDMFAGEHLVTDLLNAGLADKIEEGCEDRLGDEVLGVVEEEGVGRIGGGGVFLGEAGEAGGVGSEEVL